MFRKTIMQNSKRSPKTMLELGSGGGNNASFLKRHFDTTLVDLSADMLRVSRILNPECEHIQGDMRSIRLQRAFDIIFIHDAIGYMSTRDQLKQAITTAFCHCRPGGIALFVPDHTKESFKPATSHGGHDEGDRGIRYLEWIFDADPADEKYNSCMTYLLRYDNETKYGGLDESEFGLFSVTQWLDIIGETGFRPMSLPFGHKEYPRGLHSMFVGIKPEGLTE